MYIVWRNSLSIVTVADSNGIIFIDKALWHNRKTHIKQFVVEAHKNRSRKCVVSLFVLLVLYFCRTAFEFFDSDHSKVEIVLSANVKVALVVVDLMSEFK